MPSHAPRSSALRGPPRPDGSEADTPMRLRDGLDTGELLTDLAWLVR